MPSPNYITGTPMPVYPSSLGGNVYATLQSMMLGSWLYTVSVSPLNVQTLQSGVIGYLNGQVSSYYNLSLFYQNNISQLTTALTDVSGGDNVGGSYKTFEFLALNGTVYLPGSLPQMGTYIILRAS